eukprot:s996_g31.t2
MVSVKHPVDSPERSWKLLFLIFHYFSKDLLPNPRLEALACMVAQFGDALRERAWSAVPVTQRRHARLESQGYHRPSSTGVQPRGEVSIFVAVLMPRKSRDGRARPQQPQMQMGQQSGGLQQMGGCPPNMMGEGKGKSQGWWSKGMEGKGHKGGETEMMSPTALAGEGAGSNEQVGKKRRVQQRPSLFSRMREQRERQRSAHGDNQEYATQLIHETPEDLEIQHGPPGGLPVQPGFPGGMGMPGIGAPMPGVTELVDRERCKDERWNEVVDELRAGQLSEDNWRYLHGYSWHGRARGRCVSRCHSKLEGARLARGGERPGFDGGSLQQRQGGCEGGASEPGLPPRLVRGCPVDGEPMRYRRCDFVFCRHNSLPFVTLQWTGSDGGLFNREMKRIAAMRGFHLSHTYMCKADRNTRGRQVELAALCEQTGVKLG